MPTPITGWRLRLLGLLLAAAVAVAGLDAVARWHAASAERDAGYAEGYSHALIVAHTRHAAELTRVRDSLATVAARVDTVWRTAQSHAATLVAELPPVQTAGDTIVLTEGRFPVPHPVAVFVVQMAGVVVAQDSALKAAGVYIDVLEQKDRVSTGVIAEKDSVNALQAVALERAERAARPGVMARTWSAVKAPLAFVAGVAVGVAVVKAVP